MNRQHEPHSKAGDSPHPRHHSSAPMPALIGQHTSSNYGVALPHPATDPVELHRMLSNRILQAYNTLVGKFTEVKEELTASREEVRHLRTSHAEELRNLRDQHEREKAEALQAAEREAHGYAGILNREGFDKQFPLVFAAAKKSGKPHSIVIIDLDGFKPINDRYGHIAGDEVLKKVADALRLNCRAGDIAARVGGDEFALVLLNCDPIEAFSVAQKCLNAIETIAVGNYSLSASFGIASLHDAETRDQAYARADADMYSAKREKARKVALNARTQAPQAVL